MPSINVPVFVSHTHKDREWCRVFVIGLQRSGFDVYYDEHDKQPGDLFERLEREIKARSVFILVLSPDAVRSRWVQREMKTAMRLQDADIGRVILPVVIAKCNIPEFWGHFRRINPTGDISLSPEEAVDEVLKYLTVKKPSELGFRRVELHNLSPLAVAVPALDNQWVPTQLLRTLIKQGRSRIEAIAELEPYIRRMYLDALISADQVVINRSYIYNNPVIYRDFVDQGPSRATFKYFLQEGVIIPYLYNEQSPRERPPFDTDALGFAEWSQICREVHMHCLRLSWADDDTNDQFVRYRLLRRFHNFAQSAVAGDLSVYVRDLGLQEEEAGAFRDRLVALAERCSEYRSQGTYATRGSLYEDFVTKGNPAAGRYDSTKPFFGEIKQLLDLAYNSYLPDALGVRVITPEDSLPRTALQEWQQVPLACGIVSAEQVIDMLADFHFMPKTIPTHLRMLNELNLEDVQELRDTDEWQVYMVGRRRLVAESFEIYNFQRDATRMYWDYVELVKRMSKLVASRPSSSAVPSPVRWKPVIEFTIDIAGARLSVYWNTRGAFYRAKGRVSPLVAQRAAPVIGYLAVRSLPGFSEEIHLSTQIQFMDYRMVDAGEQWEAIKRRLKTLKGFKEIEP